MEAPGFYEILLRTRQKLVGSEKLVGIYRQHKTKLQAALSHIGINPPHIIDASWTLDFCVKTTSLEQAGSFLYLIQFHTEYVKRTVSGVWNFCVHKKNCKILYGKCVMQFDMLKKLQICETWVRVMTETLLDTKSNDTFLQFEVFLFPVFIAQNITSQQAIIWIFTSVGITDFVTSSYGLRWLNLRSYKLQPFSKTRSSLWPDFIATERCRVSNVLRFESRLKWSGL